MINPLSKWRGIRAVLAVLVLVTSSACSSYKVDFSLTNSSFKPKGKSIAVISGTKEAQNVTLAKLVGDALRKKSNYQVSQPAQVAQAVVPYPQTIKGPYKSAYFYIDSDWDLGDRKKIADIQRSLGVDYLYVIWAPIAVTSNGNNMSSVPAVAQLFEQPNAKEVAQTTITLLLGDEGSLYFKEGADEIARQLAEETHMATSARK